MTVSKRLTAAVAAVSILWNAPMMPWVSGVHAQDLEEGFERQGMTGAQALTPEDTCESYRDVSVQGAIRRFLRTHRRFNGQDGSSVRLRLSHELKRVRCSVFRNPGSAEYEEALRYIDSLADDRPRAVYDLATHLQLYWESRYGGTLLARGASRVNTGAKAGLASAAVILGTVLFIRRGRADTVAKNMGLAARYFKIIRSLKPAQALRGAATGLTVTATAGAAGYAGGGLAGDALHQSGLFDGDIPPAPAHIMGLGIPMDQFIYDYQYDELLAELEGLFAGIAAGAAVVGLVRVASAARWLAVSPNPSKLNPLVLVGSLVIGFAVAEIAEGAAERRQHNALKSDVYGARNIMQWGLDADNDRYAFYGADSLTRSALHLSTYYNKGILEAMETYLGAVGEAAEEHGEGTPAFERQLTSATTEFSDDVRDELRERKMAFNSDYQAYLIRHAMMRGDAQMIRAMGDSAVQLASYYMRGFEEWYLRHEQELDRICYAQDRRRQAFSFYLKRIDEAADRAMAREFRWEGVKQRDPNLVLMQVAAYIRNSGKAYLEHHADRLMNMVAKNIDIVQNVTGENPVLDEDATYEPFREAGERGLPNEFDR